MKELSRGDFFVPQKSQKSDTFWSYSVGQPMGVHGSFPLFHLTHYRLLEELADRVTGIQYPAFAVLGDDVIISSKPLARAYRQFMDSLGVEISQEKSLMSSHQNTFAGFMAYTTHRGLVSVFRPFKFGPDFGIQGREVSLLHNLGPEVRKWGSWWPRAYDKYRESMPYRLPDLSPMFTEPEVLAQSKISSRFFASTRLELLYNLPEVVSWFVPRDRWADERESLFHEEGPFAQVTFDPRQYKIDEIQRKRMFNPTFRDLKISVPTYPPSARNNTLPEWTVFGHSERV